MAVVEFEVEIEGVDGLTAVRDRDGKLAIFSADVTGCHPVATQTFPLRFSAEPDGTGPGP